MNPEKTAAAILLGICGFVLTIMWPPTLIFAIMAYAAWVIIKK